MINVLSRFSNCVERASIDEAYIDLTEEVKRRLDIKPEPDQLQNTFVVGHDKEGKLHISYLWIERFIVLFKLIH